jgi:hypothetical protein
LARSSAPAARTMRASSAVAGAGTETPTSITRASLRRGQPRSVRTVLRNGEVAAAADNAHVRADV